LRFTGFPTVAFVFRLDPLDLVVTAGIVLVFPTLNVEDLDVLLVFIGVVVVVLLLLLVFTALALLPFLEVDLVLTAVVLRPVFLSLAAVVLP
jgi:hypothetical protein